MGWFKRGFRPINLTNIIKPQRTPRNFVDKHMREGESGRKPSSQVHKSKKKYTRKKKHPKPIENS